MLSEDQPIFNLRAVVQETGVKPDTLRAWERRYGLPRPQRTEGGHRLYSRRDIRTIQWLLAQRDAGLSISRAVELWKELSAESGPSLLADTYGEAASLDPEGHADNVAGLRQRWMSAALAYDEGGARQVCSDAFAMFPPELVCFEVLLKGLREIGEGWYQGEVTVQQEHFATGLATRQLETLLSAAPAPTRRERILAACPPHEDHVFALLLLTLLLRRRGWDVVYLGANVPIDHIVETVREGDFSLVATSAQQLLTAASLMELAETLRNVDVPVVYGGRIFNLVPDLRHRIAGVFLGEQLEDAAQVVENVLVVNPSPIPATDAPESLTLAHIRYQRGLAAIEGTVEELLNGSGITAEHLYVANHAMEQNISSALALGDMRYLGNEVEWLEGLLRNYAIPERLLGQYLDAYGEAVDRHLDGAGEPIVKWLAQTP